MDTSFLCIATACESGCYFNINTNSMSDEEIAYLDNLTDEELSEYADEMEADYWVDYYKSYPEERC